MTMTERAMGYGMLLVLQTSEQERQRQRAFGQTFCEPVIELQVRRWLKFQQLLRTTHVQHLILFVALA